MNNICPLCKKELIEINPKPINKYEMYFECPTEINSYPINNYIPYLSKKPITHGHFDIDGGGLRAFYSEEFQLLEIKHAGSWRSEKDQSDTIFYLYKKTKDGNGWNHITNISLFEITSEEQMINRIKTLLVFS